MPWPFSGGDKSASDKTWQNVIEPFKSPQVLGATAILTAGSLTAAGIYRRRLRRIRTATHVSPDMLRARTVFGKVTSVGDGDNFRLFHTPGGRWLGWGWIPGRQVPTKRDGLSGETVSLAPAKFDRLRGRHH
jgi:hypothetical protein